MTTISQLAAQLAKSQRELLDELRKINGQLEQINRPPRIRPADPVTAWVQGWPWPGDEPDEQQVVGAVEDAVNAFRSLNREIQAPEPPTGTG